MNSDANLFDEQHLSIIKSNIDAMSIYNHIVILKLIVQYSPESINENNYGICINLSELDPSVLKALDLYINYNKIQSQNLLQHEATKNIYINEHFSHPETEESVNNQPQPNVNNQPQPNVNNDNE